MKISLAVYPKLSKAIGSIAWLSSGDFLQAALQRIKRIEYWLVTRAKANPSLLFVVSLALIEVFMNIGRTLFGDSDRYANLAFFFLGKYSSLSDSWHTEIVAMRPMIPLLASPLILILGNVSLSFGLISGFFWIGGVIVAYYVGLVFLEDKSSATLVALSYVLAPQLLFYGAGVMTDSSGYFFTGLAVYLTLKREAQGTVSPRTYFLDALVVSLGVLFRETVLFALVFMILRRFVKRKGFLETLAAAAVVGMLELAFLYAIGIGPGIFISKYLLATQVHTPSKDWGIIPYLSSLVGAYVTIVTVPKPYFTSSIFWIWILPALLLGCLAVLGFIFGARKKDLLICLLLLFPSSVIWPAMRSRFSFDMWPAVLPAIVSGGYMVFSRLRFSRNRSISDPKILFAIFLLFLGVVNTAYILIQYPSLTVAF